MSSQGHLLGGRVLYSQPSKGFRSGIEPVLLAASVAARSGEHVLEAGAGSGAALLCLAFRVPGVFGTGVEIDPVAAAFAKSNADANGFAGLGIVAGRIEGAAFPRLFDHAMANPPYHPADGSGSPVRERETAKRGSGGLILDWVGCLSAALRHRGSLTLIVGTGMAAACLDAMAQRQCPCSALFPLWPKAGRPAKLVLLRGVRNGRGAMRLMPGMVLHQTDGGYTDAAQAILGNGSALNLEG